MSASWGGGYVTDVAYMPGYYVQQSPDRMALAAQIAGFETPFTPDDPARERLSYLELGCGEGLGAAVLAAANPHWTVTAIDFNPAHIASARRLAEAAGLDNITYLEANLATLNEDTAAASHVPMCDVASLHGVWSWVPAPVQAGITRLLRDRVKAGGLVHVSYNALPAWQSGIAMQRMIREAGRRLSLRSDLGAGAGREATLKLLAAEARQLSSMPLAASLLEKIDDMPREYLAHEFMNDSWQPCWHADVVAALAEAKLDWIGPSQPLESFLDLMLTPEQREVHDRFEDPLMRELVKDICGDRLLRHDLFVRGARRMSEGEREAVLARTTLMLALPPEAFEYDVQVPAGKAAMGAGVYKPIATALGERSLRVAELVALPELVGRGNNLPELVAMLVGSHQAIPLARPEAPPSARAQRFNAAAARRFVRIDRLARGGAAASERIGGGFVMPLGDAFLLERVLAAGGLIAPEACVAEIGAGLSEEDRAGLAERLGRSLDTQPAIWRHAGLL